MIKSILQKCKQKYNLEILITSIILVLVIIAFILSSISSISEFAQNILPELVGALLTFWLIDFLFKRREEKTQKQIKKIELEGYFELLGSYVIDLKDAFESLYVHPENTYLYERLKFLLAETKIQETINKIKKDYCPETVTEIEA